MKTFIALFTALMVLNFSALSQELKPRKHLMDSTKTEKMKMMKQHQAITKHDKKAQQYTCSMHPEVISSKPGKCPKCGMALVKLGPKKVKEMAPAVYTCPMHPEVHSDKPGKCPICKMALEKVKKDK
ncbi:MAG: hypothetical protein EHM64_04150 [Ignavibacteriae bacterium]|nr:MAG: hypothetical protein EHM64_04150 [Ignavibacteriota bacterium]